MGYLSSALTRLGLAQPGPKITAHDRAVLDLKTQRDKLRQYQKRIQVVLDREHEIAREALKTGDKRRALTALRQRKFQEQLLVKTDTQLQTLQELVQTIEFTQIQSSVVHGLEQGSAVLSQLQAEMSLERVERLMDRTAAGVEYQREVDAALQSQMSGEDEDAVLRELAQMERDALPQIPDVPAERVGPVELPDAPTAEPAEPARAEPAQADEARVALAA
ncbi:Vacuolar protein sorting-associated protein 20 [Cryptotrichosporon argae]